MNWKYSPEVALGLTVYGNGGMNTDYPGGQISAQSACGQFRGGQGAPYNMLCGSGSLGVDLTQLIIAPYASWQFVKNHSIGIAPLIAYQRFKAEGLQVFDNPAFSTAPGQRDEQRLQRLLGRRRPHRIHGPVHRAVRGRRRVFDQDQHGRIRQVQGAVRGAGRLRPAVEFHRRDGVPADQGMAARARLRADLLQRCGLGQQSQRLDRLLRPAANGRTRPAQLLPRRQRRRGLRLAGHQRLEGRRPVSAERPVDVPRRLQLLRQSDPVRRT